MLTVIENFCPCCGYKSLDLPAWDGLTNPVSAQGRKPPYSQYFGEPSYEVCPCCGFEFGNDDEPEMGVAGDSLEHSFERWYRKGCSWFDPNKEPSGWSVKKQLNDSGLTKFRPAIEGKNKTIHVFQHVPYETPDLIVGWANSRNIELKTIKFWLSETVIPSASKIDELIVMGGPMNVDDVKEFPWLKSEIETISVLISQKKKVLGICLGAQLIAKAAGAAVYKNTRPEIGWFPIVLDSQKPYWFKDFSPEETVFHWHGDTFDLPKDATNFASSRTTTHQAFYIAEHVLGLQFHIEVSGNGVLEFEEFLEKDCEKYAREMFVQDVAEIKLRSSQYNKTKHLHGVLDHFFQIS
jgi:GMP synthase-like glutamine amidotransferase